MTSTDLFTPITIGGMPLSHRVVMAPLTRMRATVPGNAANEMMATYYAQRACRGGLIIAEASQVSEDGRGAPCTPGIHSPEQIAGWKLVSDAVHAEGGKIFLQLWHMGRLSHSSHQPDGGLPIAPSAVAADAMIMTPNFERVPAPAPRALETAEIPGVIERYVHAARCAMEAGFDGVEIHSANGYLLEQFLQTRTNPRTDAYGGSLENRMRFALSIVRTVRHITEQNDMLQLYRHTPVGKGYDIPESIELAKALIREGVDIIDISPASVDAPADRAAPFMDLGVPVIAVNELDDIHRALEVFSEDRADLIAIGRGLIADPEWPIKVQEGRFDDIVTCMKCDEGCFGNLKTGDPVACVEWKP